MTPMNASAGQPSFAGAAARLRSARTNARERRRFRRMPVIVGGRMLDPLGREHDCRTADISPGDARIAAPILPNTGDRVVLYLEGFGRVSGHVSRRINDAEFAVIFDSSPHKREKMAETLTWISNKTALGLDDDLQRVAVRDQLHYARIELEDGGAIDGEVLDFSLAGMTVRSPKHAPSIGSWVRVGGVYGRVARRIEGGFAVDFTPRDGRGDQG